MCCRCARSSLVGRALGRVGYVFSRRDRRIAAVNVALCLPDWSDERRRDSCKAHFESLGCALVETGLVWWASDARLQATRRTSKASNICNAALANGRGALMLSAHFTTLEMGARALTLLGPTSIMYLTPTNPLIAELSRRGRSRHTVQAICGRSDSRPAAEPEEQPAGVVCA